MHYGRPCLSERFMQGSADQILDKFVFEGDEVHTKSCLTEVILVHVAGL
jgi:hypothetical protein